MKSTRVLRSLLVASLLAAAASIPCAAQEREELPVTLEKATAGFRFVVHGGAVDARRLEEVAARKEAVRERLRSFLGERAPEPAPIAVHLYPRCSEKGFATGDTRLAHAVPEGSETHLALEPGTEGDAWDVETVVLLRRALGEPRTRALEIGLGVYLSGGWREQGWEFWAARLAEAGLALPLAELLDNELLAPGDGDLVAGLEAGGDYPLRASPLFFEPLAASLVAWRLETAGREAFVDGYAEWRPEPADVGRLERGWRRWLDRLAGRHREAIAAERARFPRLTGLQKGVNHTFEGFAIETGYLSRGSDEALARARSLHANAVALVPFTYYVRRDGRASPLPFLRGAGKENDESLIHAGLEAERLGMTVLLKPQIQGLWPGRIEMASATEWDRFFAYYERWIRHYALLAEMYGFEAFALGVELVRATDGHEERWREMAARIRRLYSGELVYCANWGGEFERLGFWDAFDYVGVDSYFPLSGRDEPSDAELLAGARAAVARIEAVHRRSGKPVLVTEVGFASARAPWKEPWKDEGGALALEHQARAYEAMLRALAAPALDGGSWLRGMYWWKWSSHPRRWGGPRDPTFVLNGKPAEEVLAKWFERLEP